MPQTIIDYLVARGISEAVQERNDINWDARIVIPIFDRGGNFIFNKYRRAPWETEGPKYMYDKGSKSALYGINKLASATVVIICEGEFDALALETKGFTGVSSTGGAGTFLPHWCAWLVGKEVYVCFDNDEAGEKGREVVQRILPDAKQLRLPSGYKDVTEFFVDGNDAFDLLAIMHESQPMIVKPLPEKAPHVSRPMPEGQTSDRLIKAKRVPITSILKFRGEFAQCPLHKDKTPSLHLYGNNRWKCFSCGRGGDVIDLVAAMDNISISDAINKLQT